MNRKTFLTLLGTMITGIFLFIWERLISHSPGAGTMAVRYIDKTLFKGVNFFDDFYIYFGEESIQAYSNVCTHAGCTLNREQEGKLICPCHGSAYDAKTGIPIKGPAIKPLRKLKVKTKNGGWIVYL